MPRKRKPRIGCVDFGDLRTFEPFSANYGFDRGRPIDRYYIENSLAKHVRDIGGRVLEVEDALYTRWFVGRRVDVSDVVHITPGTRRQRSSPTCRARRTSAPITRTSKSAS